MKKYLLILVMLLIAATSFAQPSRRTTNNARPSGNEKRTEKTDDKKKPEVRKASTRPQNKSSVDQQGVTRSRVERPDNRPSERPPRQQYSNTDRERPAGNTPSERPPRSDFSNKSNQPPPGNKPGGPDIRNDERPGTPRERKPVQPPERRENVIRQPEARPEAVKQRPPQYHSTRKFVEPRPVYHHYKRPPRPREYRAKRFPYRRPPSIHIYWSLDMRHEYLRIYPYVTTWRYPVGYRIPVISAYDALFYNDEVMSVYGRVYEVFYSGATDEYFLYFGAYYPYHDFTVVLPGWIARTYSSYPEGYFKREDLIVTGLITSYDDRPEIVVKSREQLRVY